MIIMGEIVEFPDAKDLKEKIKALREKLTCTHKPGQNNHVYYTACNLYSTGDSPFNFSKNG